MTEYAPISGGNMAELNKIPELFLNKRSLLILKNNDNKCFDIVILGNLKIQLQRIVIELLKEIKK